MYEKAFDKAQSMLELLNHTLTLFEKDFEQIKNRHIADISAIDKKLEESLEEQKKKLEEMLKNHETLLKAVQKTEYCNFLKSLSDKTDEIYDDIRKKAEQKDIEKLFREHSKHITPIIFKSLIRYVFRLGKK
jgi:DNA repair exonuclease SbcCD ATPase subunit